MNQPYDPIENLLEASGMSVPPLDPPRFGMATAVVAQHLARKQSRAMNYFLLRLLGGVCVVACLSLAVPLMDSGANPYETQVSTQSSSVSIDQYYDDLAQN